MPANKQLVDKAAEQLKFIRNLLVLHKYKEIKHDQFDIKKNKGQAIFSKKYSVGNDIYGKPRKCPFIVYHPRRWQRCLAIESRWQGVSGTVHQKFPFFVQCIRETRLSTIFVLDGGGYPDGAEEWLTEQAGKRYLKHVFNRNELEKFANDGFL